MSMFESSDFIDEESVQAARLDESLDKMLLGDESGLDYREDPELSELLAVGVALRAAADDVTSRPNFRTFHMRSRAALLQATGGAFTEQTGGIHNNIWQKVTRFKSSLVSAGLASAATLALVLVFGGSANSVDPLGSSVEQINSADVEAALATTRATALTTSDTTILVTGDSSRIVTPNQLTESVSVVAVDTHLSAVDGVTEALEQIVESGDSVNVEQIRQLTDYLAQLGFDIRINPPGNNNLDDVSRFQDVIAASVFTLESLNTEDPALLSAVLAAKVVAEDSMGIATRYVNLNLASR